jgi:hypothetical protein
MGDHARREMIVRTARVVRQNPAYRSFATVATSGKIPPEVVSFASPLILIRDGMMRLAGNWLYGIPFFIIACATPVTRPAPLPPEPVIPAPGSVNPSARAWSFNYEAGTNSYDVRRTATIDDQSDSVPAREITTNLTHESLILERVGDTIQFTVTADAFATTTQGRLGPTQPPTLPVQIVGLLTRYGLELTVDTLAEACNPARSALRSDLHNVVVPFPEQLTRGMTWQDSVELKGCQGMIPTTAHINRFYTVAGETVYNGSPVLVVERRDTIQAHGEGAQQQHQLVIDVTGSGTALQYLSTSSGRMEGVSTNQELSLVIRVSGHARYFKQSLKQEFVILR